MHMVFMKSGDRFVHVIVETMVETFSPLTARKIHLFAFNYVSAARTFNGVYI